MPRSLQVHKNAGESRSALVGKYSEEFGIAYAAFVRGLEADAPTPAVVGRTASTAERPGIPIDEVFMTEMLGVHLRRLAKSKGISQKQIAQKLKVHPSNITRIFKNPERSTMQTLARIADVLGLPIDQLLADAQRRVDEQDD